MSAVTKDQAIDLLSEAVEKLAGDDLLEVYQELFPDDSRPESTSDQDRSQLVKKLVDHLHAPREVDEVVDLWNLILPRHRNVWYNEEEGLIHYHPESEPLHAE